MPSLQTMRRFASFAALSRRRKSSRSACLYTAVWHFVIALARRIESMMDAWFSASEQTKSPSSTTVAVRPSFAFHAETYDIDASVPTNRASAVSSARWIVKVPQMKRTEPVPPPNLRSPSIPASTTAGSAQSPR